jgi:predicted amidohydrolase
MSAEGTTGGTFRVAVIQAAPVVFNLEATLAKLKVLCKTAADNGAKVIMFPEAFLSAYPRGSLFGASSAYYGNRAGVSAYSVQICLKCNTYNVLFTKDQII